MSKRVMAMLAGVAALAMLVGGCGGSDDEEESLTKAQYAKQGSKICAKEGEKLGDDLTAYGKKHDLTKQVSKEETAKLIETVIFPGFEAELEGLQELPPPEGEEEKVEAMLAQFEKGLDEGAEDPANFFANQNSEFSKATDAMDKYGVEGCGTLFL